jgi:hypothetical protein
VGRALDVAHPLVVEHVRGGHAPEPRLLVVEEPADEPDFGAESETPAAAAAEGDEDEEVIAADTREDDDADDEEDEEF